MLTQLVWPALVQIAIIELEETLSRLVIDMRINRSSEPSLSLYLDLTCLCEIERRCSNFSQIADRHSIQKFFLVFFSSPMEQFGWLNAL